MKTESIRVGHLALVEGEGGLHIKMKGRQVTGVKLAIFEPPRFFEAFLEGRSYREAPDITARICGICPVAYQLCAAHAMEAACGVRVEGPIADLRRLILLGEWIESHALHVFMLHLPGFLGFDDAVRMAARHPDLVKRGLALKKVGNDLMRFLGGREVHPVNLRVGGFYKVPEEEALEKMKAPLEWALEASLETVRFVAGLPFPEFSQDTELVCISQEADYPLTRGRVISSRAIDIPASDFLSVFEERQEPHSTALHSLVRGRGAYAVGPMARFNLHLDRLTPMARKAAADAGIDGRCDNPFKSIVVRAVELVFACEKALCLIETYRKPERPFVDVPPKGGIGHGVVEAPRGLLYHRYEVDEAGVIQRARIIAPTSQNQRVIEKDLAALVPLYLNLSREALTRQCEQAVRNYDPCISCSCHFLRLHLEKT